VDVSLRINDVDQTVSVERDGNNYTIVVAGRRYTVESVSMSDGVLNFFIGNKTYRALVSKNPLGTQITLAGRDYFLEGPDDEERSAARVHHHGDGSVEAPMPGSIIAVSVEPGDSVENGDALVVLESMKMQNEITSPVSGEVRAVNCATGDQVGFGDVLVEITPA